MSDGIKRIEEFSNLELLDELKKRCLSFIFIGLRQEEGGELKQWLDWDGDDHICYGLCFTLASNIREKTIYENIEGLDNDGE